MYWDIFPIERDAIIAYHSLSIIINFLFSEVDFHLRGCCILFRNILV